MRTAGVDLASQNLHTALCVIDWDAGSIETLRVNVADEEVVGTALAVERTGIDAPFGWPQPFVEAVSRWTDGEPWSTESDHATSLRALRYRETDLVTREITGLWPLSVSTDLISVAAIRCARLLTKLERAAGPIDRTGCTGPACEVYPAAALRLWGIPHRGYKRGVNRAQVRRRITDRLERDHPQLELTDIPALIDSDHALDAFVAALVTGLVLRGETLVPDASQQVAARAEGWIHLPRTR